MSIYRSKLANASWLLRYGIGTSLVAAAAFLRVGMTAFVTRPLSAPLFLSVIIFCVWTGGFRLGLYVSFLSGAVISYFFAQPAVGSLTPYDHVIRAGLFFAEGALVSWLMNKLRRASDELEQSREDLRDLSQRQQSERDAELKKIALEIHDELGEALTGLKLNIHFLKKMSMTEGSEENVEAGFDEVSNAVDKTIEKVRRISSELRPSILDDFGLVAALEWQVKEFSKKSGIICDFRSDSESIDFASDANTAVFRIVQEALTNIARHSGADKASVRIVRKNGDLWVEVEDNGKGIDPSTVVGPGSLGLLGMRERARSINGQLSVRPRQPLRGTTVELRLPLTTACPQTEKNR
jgi:signal transduction histidine kinase